MTTDWNIDNYNIWIDQGRPINLTVNKLNIYDSKITSLVGIERLSNLTVLDCSNNPLMSLDGLEKSTKLIQLTCRYNRLISLDGLKTLTNLTHLDCSHNKITSLNVLENINLLMVLICRYNKVSSLKGLETLTTLTQLDCSVNNITSLNELEKSTILTILHCQENKLTSLDGFDTLTNLKTLLCNTNELTSLKGLEPLTNLTLLDCSRNKITSLNGINLLTNLLELYCWQNQITSLKELGYLRRLIDIRYFKNPIDHIPPNIIRILNRIDHGQQLYGDTQSVHNHTIQESIRTSVKNILEIKPNPELCEEIDITNYILQDTILTDETKEILLEYQSSIDVYSVLDITFAELLMYVINRIELQLDEIKDEIKNILNIEMNESVCMCFTGRISRLVNCLAGFDPLVSIQIADNEQIANVISIIQRNLTNDNTYSVEIHKELVKKQLEELGYSSTIIDEWTNNIE